MTQFSSQRSRKSPVQRTCLSTLPPTARSRAMLRLTAAASEGRFELQKCSACGRFQYPPREACAHCASIRLEWTECDGSGELISDTVLHHSNELYFRERMPVRIGLVHLDIGVDVVTYVHPGCANAPARVRLSAHLDKAGQAAMIAHPPGDRFNMSQSKVLSDMTSDPRGRNILVTDGKTAMGQAMVQALIEAGASLVWVGTAEPWKEVEGLDAVAALPSVTLVPLDLTDSRSVEELGRLIGAKVDILINTAEFHRAKRIGMRGIETARAEMDVNYLGLLRLIEAFGGALKARAADGDLHATAWVNILSIYAISALPSQATFTASKAAAFALSQSLRADMQQAGIRVVNVFPGPIDDEWNQPVPPPKLAPMALAAAIVEGLKQGIEDIYPGDVAQDLHTRWRDSAKVLERELADQ
jgi:NAD(P)-dependent dehydrogenase (short-subunit alcohol dehydrogenase family)/uncharacterized OB-fold protein